MISIDHVSNEIFLFISCAGSLLLQGSLWLWQLAAPLYLGAWASLCGPFSGGGAWALGHTSVSRCGS